MIRNVLIASLVACAVGGCLGRQNGGHEPATEFEREIDAGLDGIEYRLRRLHTDDSADGGAKETLDELRRHRDELRAQLDGLQDRRTPASDSAENALRRELEDLAVRYETARLGRFESRELFEKAVEARFEDLDRELALLEGQVFQGELQESFDGVIARLYKMRNNVALRVAEAAASSDEDFPRLKGEVAAAIGQLDLLLAHTTISVDRAYEEKHPVRSLNKLWL